MIPNIKTAASRLVKHLKSLSPDDAYSKIKDKNLGKFIHNKTVSPVGGGFEGGTELRGHKNLGGVQTKFYDLESPVTSVDSVIEKVKTSKSLEKTPFAKNFTKHIKGSFGISPDKSVIKTQST